MTALSSWCRPWAGNRVTDVSVTARGKTVARQVPTSAGMPCAREVLESLTAQGLLELPQEPKRRTAAKPVVPRAGGRSLSEMIAEDRR
jgi:antitoxin (DNA-binding transcriptional repressor) of toxin-antitoxin stability system